MLGDRAARAGHAAVAGRAARRRAIRDRERRALRAGGWLVLSQALAAEHHLHIGEAFTLPSPHPTRFRVAAISTNIGWAPGAIVMNADDYARAWGSHDAERLQRPARARRHAGRRVGARSNARSGPARA